MDRNPVSNLCVGCLSDNRDLQGLSEEMLHILSAIFKMSYKPPLSMCFECMAVLRRITQFKQQIEIIQNYLLNMINERPKSLSKLSKRSILMLDNVSPIQDMNFARNIIVSLYHNEEIPTESVNNITSEVHSKKCKKRDRSNRNSVRNNEKSVKNDEKSAINDENSENYGNSMRNYENSVKTVENLHRTDDKLVENEEKSVKNDEKTVKYDEISVDNYEFIKKESTEPLAFIKVEDYTDFDMNDLKELDSKSTILDAEFVESDDEPLGKKHKQTNKQHTKLDTDFKPRKGLKRAKKRTGVVNDPRVSRKLQDLGIEPGTIALVMLTWEQVEEERQQALKSISFTRHSLRCQDCVIGFNHSHKLAQHMRKHSPEAGSEVCIVCSVRCSTRAALTAHIRRHKARWVCVLCEARYSIASAAADHCSRAHGSPPPTHRCKLCPFTADSLGKLRGHVKSHAARPVCTLCDKTFTDNSSLRTHMFVHRGDKEHACSVCEKKFTFKKQREIHEQTHRPSQHLYCYQCDVSFKNQTSYYQHKKYNLKHIDPQDIKYSCEVCGKRFVRLSRLREHNMALHLKLAPVKCTHPQCSFACASRGALRSHHRLEHGGGKALRNHVCHRCGNTYKTKKSLESHLRSHSTTEQTTQAESTSIT